MRAVFRHLLRSELRNQQSLVRWQIFNYIGAGTIEFLYENGESVTYEGVKITVVESGNFGDVVKVEKVS